MLVTNLERVVQDITIPGPFHIDGKTLVQPSSQRVQTSGPLAPDEARGWTEAAAFFSTASRVQWQRSQVATPT